MLIDGYCTVGGPSDPEPPAAVLIAAMDRAEVDRAVVAPPDRGFAWENEWAADLTAAAASAYPGRFIPVVTANPWRPDAWAVVEQYYEPGHSLLALAPGVQGFNPCEGLLDPLLERIERHFGQVPVYIHTGHHSYGAPAQLALLAERFASLVFIMGHSGSTDYAGDVVAVCRKHTNIYPESSFARPPGFLAKVAEIGYDRGIMGSGFPYNDFAFEWAEMRRLTPAEHQPAVLGGNLARLLEGKG